MNTMLMTEILIGFFSLVLVTSADDLSQNGYIVNVSHFGYMAMRFCNASTLVCTTTNSQGYAYPCSCHRYCPIWGVCCYDFYDKNPFNQTVHRLMKSRECVQYYTGISLSVVGKCPPATPAELRSKCESPVKEPTTIQELYESWPIRYDSILFHKEACMVCNGIKGYPKRLPVLYECSYGIILDNDDDVSVSTMWKYCQTKLQFTTEEISFYECQQNDCTSERSVLNGTDVSMYDLCHIFVDYVISNITSNTYKNSYCLKCESMSELANCGSGIGGNVLYIPNGIYLLFKPNDESGTDPNNRIYDLKMIFQLSSKIWQRIAMAELFMDILKRRLMQKLKPFLQYSDEQTLITNCNITDCAPMTTSESRMQVSLGVILNMTYSYTVGADMTLHVQEDVKESDLADAIFSSLTPQNKFLSYRNYDLLQTELHLKLRNDDLQCREGRIVNYTQAEYSFAAGPGSIEYIYILYSGERYRKDSPNVRLDYLAVMNVESSSIPITTLRVCDDKLRYGWLSIVSTILTIMSVCGLIFVVMTYFKYEKIRNLPGKVLVNICVCMIISLIVWILLSQNSDEILCTGAAIVLHYFWLASFLWMGIMGFDTWRSFQTDSLTTDKSKQVSLYYGYCLFAWGLSLLIVGTGVFIAFGISKLNFGYGNGQLCWLTNPFQLTITFLLPVGIILAGNFLLFLATVVNIARIRKESRMVTERKSVDFLPYVKMPVFLGVSWLLGFLGVMFNIHVLWIVFEIVNSSQGLILFLIFISTRRNRVLYGWVRNNEELTHISNNGGRSLRSITEASTDRSNI